LLYFCCSGLYRHSVEQGTHHPLVPVSIPCGPPGFVVESLISLSAPRRPSSGCPRSATPRTSPASAMRWVQPPAGPLLSRPHLVSSMSLPAIGLDDQHDIETSAGASLGRPLLRRRPPRSNQRRVEAESGRTSATKIPEDAWRCRCGRAAPVQYHGGEAPADHENGEIGIRSRSGRFLPKAG